MRLGYFGIEQKLSSQLNGGKAAIFLVKTEILVLLHVI